MSNWKWSELISSKLPDLKCLVLPQRWRCWPGKPLALKQFDQLWLTDEVRPNEVSKFFSRILPPKIKPWDRKCYGTSSCRPHETQFYPYPDHNFLSGLHPIWINLFPPLKSIRKIIIGPLKLWWRWCWWQLGPTERLGLRILRVKFDGTCPCNEISTSSHITHNIIFFGHPSSK